MRHTRIAAVLVGLALVSLLAPAAGAQDVVERSGRKYALLIAVNDYDFFSDLTFAEADISGLHQTLLGAGFDARDITVLRGGLKEADALPHRSNIALQLQLLLQSARENDLVFLAFSGHGVHLQGKSYLCPSDSQLNDPARTMVSLDEVYDMLQKCPANQKLFVVDACRNDPTPQGTRSPSGIGETNQFTRSIQEYAPPKGTILLNSCAPDQYSVEDPTFQSGVFMHFVNEGLRGAADRNGDKRVTLFELFEYAEYETKDHVKKTRKLMQTPMLRGEFTGNPELAVVSDQPRPTLPTPTPQTVQPTPAMPQPTTVATVTPVVPEPVVTEGTKSPVVHPLLTSSNRYMADGKYQEAIDALTSLIRTVDDKALLREAYRLRSSAYLSLNNATFIYNALTDAQAAGLESIKVTVRRDGSKLVVGSETRATLPKGTIVEVSEIRKGYLAVVSVNGNDQITGWMYYTAVTDPPPPAPARPQHQGNGGYYYDDYYDDGDYEPSLGDVLDSFFGDY